MRSDDLSGSKELSHPVTCYNCQREASKQRKVFTAERPSERYNGNLEIIKETPRRATDGKVYYETVCWTGKWIMKFGNFCSVKCGLIWANHTIESRRNKSKCAKSPLRDSLDEETRRKLEQFSSGHTPQIYKK